ncbi:MAG: NADH-quinone oxidoreductase subunit D [Candidatus Cloacimonetes bacterium]|nr:NADH-quinone oxidoreductase subunit D [Candidatus Cloacimonadota bacterium]
MWEGDRSKFPEIIDGKPVIDLDSQKYVKIWQGPQHPGVTGNIALEVTLCGDEVVDLKTHVGYLHRGFEKLLERRTWMQGFTIVCRICVPEPDTNEYLFAAGVEELSGITVPAKAEWIRTLTLEMARLASFLMWLGGQAAAFGMGTVGQWTVAHRDFLLDIFEELSGGRIYHMYIVPGGVRADLPKGLDRRLEDVLKKIEILLKDVDRVLFNNAIFKLRSRGLGIVTRDMVDSYGVVGPVARAAGLARDLRKDHPYLVYEKLDFDIITATGSDAFTRAQVRFKEMYQCIDLIRQILSRMPDSGDFYTPVPNVLHWKIPAGATFVQAEASRGEYGYYMVSDGTAYPRRIAVRGPSYSHAIALLQKLAINTNIADLAGLMVSLQTCPPEIER